MAQGCCERVREREKESAQVLGGEKNSPNDLNPSFIRLRGGNGGREAADAFSFRRSR